MDLHPITAALREVYLASSFARRPTTRELARRTGLSHTHVADALAGRSVPPFATTSKIMVALGGDPQQLAKIYASDDMPARRPIVRDSQQEQMLAELRAIRVELEQQLQPIRALLERIVQDRA